ncbi:hypothetical protein Tco_0456833, partial [Tanacetum coccineum]
RTFSFSWKSWPPAILSPFLLDQTHQAALNPHDPIVDNWIDLHVRSMMKPYGRLILASVEKGPLVWPSITVDGVTRLKEYTDLTPAEVISA